MRILGIDPGYDRLGIAIIEKDRKDSLVYSSCLQTSSKDEIYERFKQIGKEVTKIISEYKPDALAIETLFLAKNQKTAMRVSEARGIIIYEAIRNDIPVFEYSPLQIKGAICGNGASDKMMIIKMIPLLITLNKKKMLDDEYDAIAVALTHSALIHSSGLLKK